MQEILNKIIEYLTTAPIGVVLLFVFFSSSIQQFFPPYPAEIVLLLLGCFYAAGVLPGFTYLIVYITGTLLSSALLFFIAKQKGNDILQSKIVRRIFSKRMQSKASVYIKKYGAYSLVICKFIPGINSIAILMGGILDIKTSSAMIGICVSGIVADTVYFIAGYVIGNNIENIAGYSANLALVIALLAFALVCFLVFLIGYRRYQYRKMRKHLFINGK
jgi:membrane protein DedA with SNARE-associated domain